MNEKMKPCPFCGQKLGNFRAKYGKHGWFFFVRCEVCGAETRKIGVSKDYELPDDNEEFWKDEKVIKITETLADLWNTRTSCEDSFPIREGES